MPRSASTNSDQVWWKLPKNISRKRSHSGAMRTWKISSGASGHHARRGRVCAASSPARSSKSVLLMDPCSALQAE